MIKLSKKNIKSSEVQSPLNDQKKGVGFILVKNAIMKNIEGNFQSPGKEKAASTGDGSNFFTFLGIVIFLALMKFGPEIMVKLNSKQQQEFSTGMTQMTAQMGKAKRISDPAKPFTSSMYKYLAENSFAPKKFVPDNDSQFLNQLNQNERLLAKITEQNKDIKNAIEEKNESLEYLEGRENNREVRKRLKVFGNILLNLPF